MKPSLPVKALSLLALATSAAAQQAPAIPKDALEQAVTDWAKSWEAQNLASYFEHYHSSFTPPNAESLKSWREQRTARISSPAHIEISVCKVEVRETVSGGTGVRFWMDYKSPSYADSTLKEMVIGADQDGKLRILRENNLVVRRKTDKDAADACPVPVAAGIDRNTGTSSTTNTSGVIAAQPQPATPTPINQPAKRTEQAAAAPVQPPAKTEVAVVPPAARQPRNYAGIHAGINNLEEWNGIVELGKGVGVDGRVGLDNQWTAGLVLGREYENSRFEVEYQQGRFGITDISLGTQHTNVDDSGKYQALTLNAYRVKQLYKGLDGYLALGIGLGKATLPRLGFQNACQCFANAEESGFIWQWRLGLEYLVNERNTLSMQYGRLVDMPGPVSGAGFPSVTYEDKDISTFSVQWRVYMK